MAKSSKKNIFTDTNEEKILFEWEAAERPFKRRNRDFWITAISILVLVSVVLIFAKEFFLIVALGSALFLYYVQSTVPPSVVKNRITNRGVYFGEIFYPWDNLVSFWFGKSLDSQMIFFETALRFPPQVSLVILPKDQIKLKELIIKKLPLIKNPPGFVDKLTNWFAKRLPLEKRE